ncbi:MAG: heme lyase CcmF/NrfE family subunit [Burkholderiales bacterium]|jgi:cytochrome c-type biogenesis protein CcmF
MTAEIGQFALALALPLLLAASLLALGGAWRGHERLMAVATPATLTAFGLVLLAGLMLVSLFVNNDFSVLLVAQHSNQSLPLAYRVAASWGSHEGSMLLWLLMLTGWSAAVALFSGSLPRSLRARVLGVLGLISVGLLLFLIFTSNPFDRMVPAPRDGRDLNPLLQDPGMVFHPPLLYMGYVGFSVAFAFAVAGLLEGRFDAAWARWARPWTTVAWCFLTLGICLGSFWAYYELGWGGWWFWDPVENASFMPWLVGTALIHSLAVTEKRGSFRSWTVLLAILAFSLSLLGTFLVRSGVLTSVHAFATDPTRGVFILIFLALVIGGSLALFAWRAPAIGAGPGFGAVSRESFLLANNILLVVAMAAVLLGTLYPLALDTLGMGKISVGPPYFDTVFYPLMAPALFLMGVGPFARWRQAELPDLARRLRWALGVSVAAALLLPFTLGSWRPMVSLGLLLALWIAASVVVGLLETARAGGQLRWQRLRLLSGSQWGMHLAHLGIAVFVVGVTLVKGYETEKEHKLAVGAELVMGDYRLRFDSVEPVTGPNYDALRGRFTLLRDERTVAVLSPEKRVYRASRQPMTEAAIHRSLTRDVYLSMGEPLPDGAWAIRAQLKPFVNWIWLGCVLMALGGFSAVLDARYRRASTRRSAATQAGIA